MFLGHQLNKCDGHCLDCNANKSMCIFIGLEDEYIYIKKVLSGPKLGR